MPSLNVPQAQYLNLEQKYRAFVGGFGSGKTRAGAAATCRHSLEFPRINAGYFAPTYGHIRDIYFETIEETAADWSLRAKVNASNKEVHLFNGRSYRSTIICRSMDDPAAIVGFKIGRAHVDELDVMKVAHAEQAWRKIIARMRQTAARLPNAVDVTTTPEGFRFVYQQWVKAVRDKPDLGKLYGLVQASTYQNGRNLPEDYIPSLLASYPPQLISAYLKGKFVNLTSGSIYGNFDRKLNHTDETIKPGEALHIGMDFNRLNMTAVISVIRDGLPLTLAEITKGRDTPEMAKIIKERYVDKKHPVMLYPDASGKSSSSKNASESDFTILRGAGMSVTVNPANPAVIDRVYAVDAMTLNAEGRRRWLVNTHACPALTEAQEQQTWAPTGEPDKSTGHDHPNDAIGYFIVKCWPIVKRGVTVTSLRA